MAGNRQPVDQSLKKKCKKNPVIMPDPFAGEIEEALPQGGNHVPGASAIRDHSFDIRAHLVPRSELACSFGDHRRARLSLFNHGFQSFNGDRTVDQALVAERVGERFRNRVHSHGGDPQPMLLNAFGEVWFTEANGSDSRVGDLGLPVFGANGDPDPAWYLIREAVKRQQRGQTDDGLRGTLGDFDEIFVRV